MDNQLKQKEIATELGTSVMTLFSSSEDVKSAINDYKRKCSCDD